MFSYSWLWVGGDFCACERGHLQTSCPVRRQHRELIRWWRPRQTRINSEKVPSGVLLFPDWEIESSINSLTLGLNEDARRVSAHAAAAFLQLSGQKELIFTALLRIHHSDICPSGTWHPLVLNSSSSSSSRTKDTEKFSALFSRLQKSANGVLIQTTPPRGTRRTAESDLDYIYI